ncbi:MAG: DUF4407 domain-containing protein [Verrucomicrobiaceae bacterium]
MKKTGKLTRAFIWLSGASGENLDDCPPWERRKYVAFGATVLVPCVFALIAAAYAVSTLTDDWRITATVAVAWGFIIMTVDRALLATYRAYQGFFRKLSQLGLRVIVAALMGITISHPLTLLLFKDTIGSVIEKERDAEISQVRANGTALRKDVESKITVLDGEIAESRLKWDETFSAKFLAGEEEKEARKNGVENKAKTELDKAIAEAQVPTKEKLQVVEKEIAAIEEQSKKLQTELDFWQKEFEREVNGQRSGIVGLGPRASSIQTDQLAWRRDETKRLSSLLDARAKDRIQLQAEATSVEQNLTAAAETKATEQAMKLRQEAVRLDALRSQVQQQQADQFVTQQNQIRATLKAQIDSKIEQSKAMQEEIVKLDKDETTRVTSLRSEPRRDILKQTLALHRLFNEGAEGGKFALTAYLVLTMLFMMVDTIPVMVKFFSKPGPYDTLVDCDEVRFDNERDTFLKSYKRYMEELGGGKLLHLTRHKPLELALVEGVDRSRVAKEFLESLIELEKTFEARIHSEREAMLLSGARDNSERIAMLQHMAETFYKDLRNRMEHFFTNTDTSRSIS